MIDFNYPKTVKGAVDRLISRLPLKERVYLAGLDRKALDLIHSALGSVIREDFGLAAGNLNLIRSCREASGRENLTADEAYRFLIETLWKTLRDTHAMRVVTKNAVGEPPSAG
jgi:hypothetical protein